MKSEIRKRMRSKMKSKIKTGTNLDFTEAGEATYDSLRNDP